MKLEGSCHCGAVRFTMESPAPYPYMRCYCSICRKTGGGGGYAINLMGHAASLTVEGEADMAVYQATLDGALSPAERHFCLRCGSALWVFDPTWPELIHPFASAIDSALPMPPETLHIMLDSKPPGSRCPKATATATSPNTRTSPWRIGIAVTGCWRHRHRASRLTPPSTPKTRILRAPPFGRDPNGKPSSSTNPARSGRRPGQISSFVGFVVGLIAVRHFRG